MRWEGSSVRYGSLLIQLHWLMLLLVVAVYACIELRVLYPKGSEIREALKTWHFMLGLGVFALVWLRLLVRLFSAVPPIAPPPPRWQMAVAHASEFAIYAFMVVMPLLGWLTLSGENTALAKKFKSAHEFIGTAGYFLIGIHALAALTHHYIQRDNTLTRMLPSRRPG